MVTPAGWLIPLAFLGVYLVTGAAVGVISGAIASRFRQIRPRAFAADALVGAFAGLLGGAIVGWAHASVTTFLNGRAIDGWGAFVVNHESTLPTAFVIASVVLRHVLMAPRRGAGRGAA